MVSWIIIVALVIFLLMFFKAKRAQHRVYAILIILLLVFFLTTTSKIIEENAINIKTFDGMVLAGKLYFNWLISIFGNVRNLAGNAIKMNWVGNSTLR